MTDPPDAPWIYVWKTVTVEGKEYTVYYLGSEGKKLLENAQCKTQCWQARDQFEKDIKELKSMLNVLTDMIGPNAVVEYFKGQILVQIGKKSCRTGVLVSEPYSAFKYTALQELLDQGKVVHTRNGWWKLGKSKASRNRSMQIIIVRNFKGSSEVDLDKVLEVAKHNPKNAILMLVAYLKIKERTDLENGLKSKQRGYD